MRVQARDRVPVLPFGGGASPPTLPHLRALVRGMAALTAALLSRAVTLWIWIPVGLGYAVASTRESAPPFRQEAASLRPAL